MTTYPNAEYWRKRAVTNAQARNGYMRHGRAQADKLDLAEGQIRFFEWQVREYSSTQNKHLARIDELEAQVKKLEMSLSCARGDRAWLLKQVEWLKGQCLCGATPSWVASHLDVILSKYRRLIGWK